MEKIVRIRVLVLWFAASVLTACASAPIPSTIIKTLRAMSPEHPGFSNMLVISVAGDFESRGLFERQFIAAMAGRQGKATAYYTVIGRSPYVTRTAMNTAIRARGFDAVLLTREKGQEREALAPGRPVGAAFDLFLYDYAELNNGESIEQSAAITFVTELYSVAGEKKIWSIESLSFDKISATELINEQAAMISQQVIEDRLLRP